MAESDDFDLAMQKAFDFRDPSLGATASFVPPATAGGTVPPVVVAAQAKPFECPVCGSAKTVLVGQSPWTSGHVTDDPRLPMPPMTSLGTFRCECGKTFEKEMNIAMK